MLVVQFLDFGQAWASLNELWTRVSKGRSQGTVHSSDIYVTEGTTGSPNFKSDCTMIISFGPRSSMANAL